MHLKISSAVVVCCIYLLTSLTNVRMLLKEQSGLGIEDASKHFSGGQNK